MQLSLFDPVYDRNCIPSFIQAVMAEGATLAVSISGGKDSDAMLRFLALLYRQNGWRGDLFALFCELGRIEWAGVNEHLHRVCSELETPLVKRYPNRSMVEEWQHRYEVIVSRQQSKPFWSSSSARYCTKHEKTQPADKLLRQYDFIVCAIGLRAEESSARAKKPRYQVRNDIASTWYKTPSHCKTAEEKEVWAEQAFEQWLKSGRRGRFALSWHPIHHWSLDEVWQYNGTSTDDVARRRALYQGGKLNQALSAFPCHWAYVAGNTRLSCSLCVLASSSDIYNGAQHNRWVWAELALMEMTTGWSFQQPRWLASLNEDVLKVTLKQRQRLHRVLRQLGLVSVWHPVFQLNWLSAAQPEQSLFWTEAAFCEVALLISRYWNDRVTANSKVC